MLWFYSLFNIFVSLLFGIALINQNNKNQKTAGTYFCGIAFLGIFCLLIEFFVFGDFI